MTISKTSSTKLVPILKPLIQSSFKGKNFRLDDVIKAFCSHYSITEDAWGIVESQGHKPTWVRFNIIRSLSKLWKGDDPFLIQVSRGVYRINKLEPIEKPVEAKPVEVKPEEIKPVEEPKVEEPKVEEVVEPVSFELPKPPEDRGELDDHMVKVLKEATGCFGYYSPKATACGHCPLAHHCAKELANVMATIGKALI